MIAWLAKNNVIEEEDMELYQYAWHSLLLFLGPLLFGLIGGIALGKLSVSIVTILPFMFLRKFCGGYHTRHWWNCMLLSTLTLYFALFIQDYLRNGIGIALAVAVASIMIIVVSPLESVNRLLSEEERVLFKKGVIGLVIIFDMTYSILSILHYSELAVANAVGICLTFAMQIPVVVLRNQSEIKK